MRYILALFLVILALLVAPSITNTIDSWNENARAQRRLDLAKQEWQFERQREWDKATQAGSVAFYYAGLLGGVAALVLSLDWLRRSKARADRRFELAMFGGYPVARKWLEYGDDRMLALLEDTIRADKVAKIEEARRPIPPAHLTYAPKYSGDASARLEAVEALAEAQEIPTFAKLLDRQRVGKGNPLVLGFDAGGNELTGSWLDLYSTAVAGMPGTGKTTSQRFLACQTALHGARFAVVDPHAGASDDSLAATLAPLASAFVCEPASTDKAILEVVRLVADTGKRRIEGKDKDTTPLILWVDECTALLGRSAIGDELGELLERVAQEYRKRYVFVCASGQIWTAARTGSELRDSFASVLCHRMKRGQARLLLPTDEAAQVERLSTGRAVLWRTSGETQVVAIPDTRAQDVQRVAGLLAGDAPTVEASWKPFGSTVEAPYSAQVSAIPQNAQAARILAAFRGGTDISEIARDIAGSGSGRAYASALAEVNRVLRDTFRVN